MRFISGIINIVVGLIIIGFGFKGFYEHFGGNEKKIVKFENLLENGVEIIGTVDSVYTEIKIKSSTTYSSKYFFEVDGNQYSGSFSFDSPAELLPIIKVHYMPVDPSINDVKIEEQLAKAKGEADSNSNLIIGIGALILGSLLIYFRGIRRFMAVPEEEKYERENVKSNLDKDFS